MATPKPPLWIPELRLMECRLYLGIAQYHDGPDARADAQAAAVPVTQNAEDAGRHRQSIRLEFFHLQI